MKNWKTLCGTSAVIALMTGSVAFADVTPQDVWGDWKTYVENYGYSVQGTESQSGKTLTISGAAMSMDIPDGEGAVKVTMDPLTFTDNGDGTVTVGFPATMPMDIKVTPKVGKATDISVEATTNGMSMTASGTPDDMLYTYSAANVGLALRNLVVDGKPITGNIATMDVTGIAGTATMKRSGDLRTTDQTMSASGLTYALDFADPEGTNGRMKWNGSLGAITSSGATSIPSNVDMSDMAAAMAAGFAVDAGFAYTSGQSAFNILDKGQEMQGQTSSASGSLDVKMSADALGYSGDAKDVSVQFMGGQIPFPIAMQMATSAFNLKVPVAKSDEAKDFAFGITLGDFTMSDMIWGIFDPTGQLPRDPATIAIDLSGKARMLVNIMDQNAMTALNGTPPGEVDALSINTLQITAAGADMTGNGGFTFDNADKTTFPGMPKPTGEVNLKLVGGNGLLDKLVAMGLLPEDQAMGARMMMGLFAVPAAEPDTLTSKIEINDQGHVLANGQRLK